MGIVWCIAGLIVVSGSFLLAPGNDIWSSLNAAGVASALYLMALAAYATRRPFPRMTRVAFLCVFLLSGACVFFCWRGAEKSSCSQVDRLGEMHAVISRNVMIDVMPAILLRAMSAYYAQPPDHRRAIGAIFRETYPAALPGINIHRPFSQVDSLMVCVSALSGQEVRLVGQEMYVRGRNPQFRNYNGRVGMVQSKAVLTEEGVRYESEN